MSASALAESFPIRDPRQALRVVRQAEVHMRERADDLDLRAGQDPDEHARSEARALVTESAMILETTVLLAGIAEVAAEMGVKTYGELPPGALDEVARRVHIDLDRAADEHAPMFLEMAASQGIDIDQVGAQTFPTPPLSVTVRQAKAVVNTCPIETIERAASIVGREDYGHRCRVALDVLRAFLRRRSTEDRSTVDILGRAYASGALSLGDVASVLQSPSVHVVAELEARGYWRSVETVALSDDERASALARIREERIRRAGKPASEPEAAQRATRSAIASARIEGIDARAWLRDRQS